MIVCHKLFNIKLTMEILTKSFNILYVYICRLPIVNWF